MASIFPIFVLSAFLISLLWHKLMGYKNGYSLDHEVLSRRASKTMKQLATLSSLPILGSFHHILKFGMSPFQVSLEWVKKYGNIFKIKFLGETFIYLNEPTMVQKILSSTNPNHLNKNRKVYDSVLTGRMADGLVAAEYALWSSHRRIISRSFNFQSLQQHLSLINRHSREFVAELQRKVDGKPAINEVSKNNGFGINEMLHNRIMKLVLHTIMELETCTDQEWSLFHEGVQTCCKVGSERIKKPWLLIEPLWKIHPLRKTHLQAIDQLDKVWGIILDKYKRQISKGKLLPNATIIDDKNREQNANTFDGKMGVKLTKCMLEQLIESGMSDKEILDEVLTILAAGHETSSNSLTFLLFNLARKPDIQEKCREEIDQLFNSKISYDENEIRMNRSNDTNDSILLNDLTMDDLAQLKYLEHCILENLRMFPVLPWIVRRLDGPLEINDSTVLPGGVSVILPPWTLHRDPNIFRDPEKFDPDRFSPENCKKRDFGAFIPFSSGVRNCVGWKTAMMTIKVMAALILKYFKVETTQKEDDIQLLFEVTLRTKQNIELILTRRS